MPGHFFFNWMPDIVKFILFCVRDVCIPINIAELCFGTQLSHRKQLDVFKSHFLAYFHREQNSH